MATRTLGTNANNSLTAVKFSQGLDLAEADVATLALMVKDDQNIAHPLVNAAFSKNGQLYIPNRGWLRVLPGDYVGVDATTGWPILLSAFSIASGPWTHT